MWFHFDEVLFQVIEITCLGKVHISNFTAFSFFFLSWPKFAYFMGKLTIETSHGIVYR